MASPTEIRKGRVINYNGSPHTVLEMLHRTQGRQAGFVQVTLRNLDTGSTTNVKYRSTDNVEFMHTENQRLEFSYIDQEGYHFMNTETFDDIIIQDKMVADLKKFMAEGTEYEILFVDDRPITVQLPVSVELKVVESPEGIKGDTASNVQKPATMETGLVVQVPLFIKEGEIIKVSTESSSYLGRA
jgi:elongation factor P